MHSTIEIEILLCLCMQNYACVLLVYLSSDSGRVLDVGAKFKEIQGHQVIFSQAQANGDTQFP